VSLRSTVEIVKWFNLAVAASILGAGIWAATLIRDGSGMALDLVHTAESIRAQAVGQGMMGLGYLFFVVITGYSLVLLRPRWLALGSALPAAVAMVSSALAPPAVAGAITLFAVPFALLASAAGVVVYMVRASIVDDVVPEAMAIQEPSVRVSA
jgi:predicted anti-sigma-YlaC factor YlaD